MASTLGKVSDPLLEVTLVKPWLVVNSCTQ